MSTNTTTAARTPAATRTIAYTALFAALSTVLMMFSFPLPFFPPFLKFDLSGVPILLTAFMFGPLPAVLAAAVKDLINALFSTSGGVGELSDFFVTAVMALTAGLVYRRRHTRSGALLACILGAVLMALVAMVTNRFLIIPFYMNIMPLEAILAACAKVNPLIGDINTYILLGAGPFTLVKGILLSVVTFLLYKRLHTFIQGR